MATARDILADRLRRATAERFPGARPEVVAAADARFGDYQSNVALTLAKSARLAPRKVAEEIVAVLDVEDLCEPVEIAGAGFINFRLRPASVASAVSAMAADPRLGVAPASPARRVIIDFSSPNVAKPMHVGHIRSTLLGDALSRVGEFLGHHIVRDNHIGDWGTQFGMLLHGWKTALDRTALAADALSEMARLYKLVSAQSRDDETVRQAARNELVKLQNGDEENLAIWKDMIRLSEEQFAAVYRRLDVRFDVAHGESFYNPWLKDVVAELADNGIARESDGALCVFSDGTLPPKDDPFLVQRDGKWTDIPAIVRKEDGAANYMTTDLATLAFRLREWSPDTIIYVTDGRQQLHFRQVFAIFRRWKRAAAVRLEHVWFGTILGEDGKPFKTRSGESIRLTDLLDEAEERAFALVSEKNPSLSESERREIARVVGLGAIKYADLLPARQGDYVFSWDRMLSFQGNTAPYLQNAYVRIRSIFRRGEIDEASVRAVPIAPGEPAEIVLAKKLLQFAEVLPVVFDEFRPNLLANYLYELAGLFHSFFEACPVLKSPEPQRSSRLALCDLAARVIRQGLGMLGISCPERM